MLDWLYHYCTLSCYYCHVNNVFLTGESVKSKQEKRAVQGPKFVVELKPMEIRTFKVAIKF